MSIKLEEEIASIIQSKPSVAVSELTINSTINMDGYESKYTRNITMDPPVKNTQVVEENDCIPNFIKFSRYESKRKIVIPLDPNIHEHREKAYEVLGTTESIYNTYNVNEEDEHKTETTAPLTEYNFEVQNIMKDCIIDEINHDRDQIKTHFQDEPDPVHLHFYMRYGYLAFFWRLVSRCCSWFSCICVVIIYQIN